MLEILLDSHRRSILLRMAVSILSVSRQCRQRQLERYLLTGGDALRKSRKATKTLVERERHDGLPATANSRRLLSLSRRSSRVTSTFLTPTSSSQAATREAARRSAALAHYQPLPHGGYARLAVPLASVATLFNERTDSEQQPAAASSSSSSQQRWRRRRPRRPKRPAWWGAKRRESRVRRRHTRTYVRMYVRRRERVRLAAHKLWPQRSR